MRVIPSALLLSIGSVVAQDDGTATPALISTTSSSGVDAVGDPVPTLISADPDATPIPDLFDDTDSPFPDLFGGDGDGGSDMFGDLGGFISDIFGGDDGSGGGQDMFGDLNDMLTGMFGGGDTDADSQATILENLLGAGSSSGGSIDLECPSSCSKPDLCEGDLMTLIMGGMDTLQEMCDTGCIPTIVLDACDTDAVPAAAAAAAGGTAAFIANAGVCDFVNCCVAKEQEDTGDAAVVVSPTRTKFDECQAELPEMADLGTSDFEDFGDMFDMNMTEIQDMFGEIVEGFEEMLDQFSDMFADMFDSSSIPAFCAVDTCVNAPAGFCECFSGDLAQCNKDVISQACTSDSFSTCAPEGFTEFCSNECGQSSGTDILHMCAMCNVVTCCSKDNSEIEGCLSEALAAVDHSQVVIDDAAFSELEDLLGGMDLEGMLTEILGNMESMEWCPKDKTCPIQQFCEIANGGPSAIDSDTAVSPRTMDLQSFNMGSMGMDLDEMCSSDMLLGCGPVDMKAKCDSVCGADDNDGIMKEAFCRLCGVATCCGEGEGKTFSECSVTYIPSEDSSANQPSGDPNQDPSTPEPPKDDSEVTNETNTASDGGAVEADSTEAVPEDEESAETEAAELEQPAQIAALENSVLEKENSGMTSSSVSFFTAIVSTGLVLALY